GKAAVWRVVIMEPTERAFDRINLWKLTPWRQHVEAPKSQCYVYCERPRCVAPVAKQLFDGRQSLSDGVEVNAQTLGGHLCILIAVKVVQHRRGQFRTTFLVL